LCVVRLGFRRLVNRVRFPGCHIEVMIMIHGKGFIGIGKYTYKDIAYKPWLGMMDRCYSKSYLKKFPTYIGCKVCNQWHDFQVFAKWYHENRVEGWHIDKDLLGEDLKLYSPETCCFLPSRLNSLIIRSRSGIKNKGIFFIRNRYQAQMSGKYIGCFKTEQEATKAYGKKKKSLIVSIALDSQSKLSSIVLEKLLSFEI